MDKNYEILGLPIDCDKKLVEAKYGALLRQYKQRTDEYGTTSDDLDYYNKITRAYDSIMGIDRDYTDTDPTSIIPYSVRKRWYKFSAYIENYKLLILGVFIVCVIACIIVLQFRDSSKEDLYVKFVGSYAALDAAVVGDEIDEKSEVTDYPLVSFFTVDKDNTTMYDTAAKQASVQFRSELMARRLDIILIDIENFEVYLDDFAFLRLDDFIDEYKDQFDINNFEVYSYENKGGEDELQSGIYGIYITDSPYFKDSSLVWLYEQEERTMILTICRSSKNIQRAKDFASELLVLSQEQ